MFANVRTVCTLITIPNGYYFSGQTGEEYDTGSIDISYGVSSAAAATAATAATDQLQ